MRVLVVDDSRFSRGVLKSLFEKLQPGCTVVEAGDAPAALSSLATESFDLVTIDLHMPGKDGLQLAEELIEKETPSRLALISANHQAAIVQRAERLGLAFVAKPLSEKKLLPLLPAR